MKWYDQLTDAQRIAVHARAQQMGAYNMGNTFGTVCISINLPLPRTWGDIHDDITRRNVALAYLELREAFAS